MIHKAGPVPDSATPEEIGARLEKARKSVKAPRKGAQPIVFEIVSEKKKNGRHNR